MLRFIPAVLFLVLLIKYMLLKKQIRNLTDQMAEKVHGASEKMMDISLIDRDLESLAGVLNQYNEKQRYSVACAVQHEEHLKESIANISHDLRTPLTVILGHLQLLEKMDFTEEQAQRLKIILHKAERMKDLVDAFYDLIILENEQLRPQKEKLNLSNLLMDFITEQAPAMESRGIHPEIILPAHSVVLFSDRSMIDRIFQNLLTNAIRYSAGTIKISLFQTEKNGIVFCIENTVQDMEALDAERMFERFYTGDKSRHTQSTGLGLAVVKLLVENLEGNIMATVHAGILEIKVVL